MRGAFYCHSVQSQDDGRTKSYMTVNDEVGKVLSEITIVAPFEEFSEGNAPRAWHRYKVTIELIEEQP